MNTEPITERDVAFARAVVALARAHGMDGLRMEFRHNFRTSVGVYSKKNVQWSEGRHGDDANIMFNLEAAASFSEKDEQP